MPLPGDPDAVLAASDQLRTAATGLQAGHDALAARGRAMSSWAGQAADAARATIENHAHDLGRAADAASQAVGPLARYADELRAAQADYGRAEQAMLDGQGEVDAAGSGAVAAAEAARDAAEQAMDDAATLMITAEERARAANEAAARAVTEAASGLGGLAPPAAPASPPDSGVTFADLGNALASFGNAALHDPVAVATMALGAGEVLLGAGGEIGGFALDLTGGGTVAGVPVGIASAGLIATGVTTLGAGVMTVAQNASGPDRVDPFQSGSSGPPPPARRPDVSDPKLRNIVNSLYRGAGSEARTGSGTTADAVRYERATGNSVNDKFHTEKANNSVRALRSWLRRNPQASVADRHVAQQEYDDLLDALGRTR